MLTMPNWSRRTALPPIAPKVATAESEQGKHDKVKKSNHSDKDHSDAAKEAVKRLLPNAGGQKGTLPSWFTYALGSTLLLFLAAAGWGLVKRHTPADIAAEADRLDAQQHSHDEHDDHSDTESSQDHDSESEDSST